LLSFSSYSSILDIIILAITSQIIVNYTQYRDSNSTKWNDGKTEKGWKPFPPNNKLVQGPEGNEENRHPDPDSNKTKINHTKEPNEAYKNALKEEILQVINENFIEMIWNMVNQNV
jgi:hypothetical protein